MLKVHRWENKNLKYIMQSVTSTAVFVFLSPPVKQFYILLILPANLFFFPTPCNRPICPAVVFVTGVGTNHLTLQGVFAMVSCYSCGLKFFLPKESKICCCNCLKSVSQELCAQLASAADLWKSRPNPANKKDAIAVELDLLASEWAEKVLRWTKHRYYSCANKPGTMLVRKVNTQGHTDKPIRLRSTNGDLTSEPSKISKAFADFLASLYSKPTPFALDLAKNFFRDLHLPSLSSEALNADATALEVAQAIKSIHPSVWTVFPACITTNYHLLCFPSDGVL